MVAVEPIGNPMDVDIETLKRELDEAADGDRERVMTHADIRELIEYAEKYEAIVVRCRLTKGPCFCGVHLSQVQQTKR